MRARRHRLRALLHMLLCRQERGALCLHRMQREGMHVRRCFCGGRRLMGTLLVLSGVLIIFLCLPMRVVCTVLGVMMAAAGLLLLR